VYAQHAILNIRRKTDNTTDFRHLWLLSQSLSKHECAFLVPTHQFFYQHIDIYQMNVVQFSVVSYTIQWITSSLIRWTFAVARAWVSSRQSYLIMTCNMSIFFFLGGGSFPPVPQYIRPPPELARVLLVDSLQGANWPGSENARYPIWFTAFSLPGQFQFLTVTMSNLHWFFLHCGNRKWTRGSAIAERLRCRARYSFRQK